MAASLELRALALAALVPLAGCSDADDNNPTGPAAGFLVAAVLDAGGGVVTVTDDSDPVAGATVQLNGVAGTAGASIGEYQVRLPSPVAPGGALTLEVGHGGRLVTASGTVPESPVMTGASSADSFDPAFPLQVTWTDASDPGSFEVVAVGPSIRVFQVEDATARSYTVPAGTLAKGNWDIRARAVNNGVLGGDAEPNSSMVISADAASPISIQLVPRLLIQADLNDSSSSTSLILEGRLVDAAAVTVNGEAAIQALPGQPYTGHLAAHASVGDPLTLSVTLGADTYTATGNVPEAPIITMVRSGSRIQVEWTSDTDPDHFAVRVFSYLASGYRATYLVDGTSRFVDIPGVLNFGRYVKYMVRVDAIKDGAFTGIVHPDSRMEIRAGASQEL